MVNKKGTYALILKASAKKHVVVGRLGRLRIEPGFYMYIGSAFGPGGLKARMNHHLTPVAKPHWHIDYLRGCARVVEIWYTTDPLRREHDWVTSMEKLQGAVIVHPGFGATDSRDVSHLYFAQKAPGFEPFVNIIRTIPNHCEVFVSKLI